MRMRAFIVSCVVLVLLGSSAAPARGQTRSSASEEAHLKELSKAWMQAWKDRDRATLERVLADDFALVISTSPDKPVDRASWLAMAFDGYVCEAFEYRNQQVRLLGGTTAIVASLYSQKASVNGQDRSGEFFLTDVWQWRDGRWQVVARYSAKPESASASAGAVIKKDF